MGRWLGGNTAAIILTESFVSHLCIVLFAGLVVCIEAGLSILRAPNPETPNGEVEPLDRLPSAF